VKTAFRKWLNFRNLVGEPFSHYMLINTERDGEHILQALKEGSFVSVKQLLPGRTPGIRSIGVSNRNVHIEFDSTARYIGFVGDNGRTIRSFEDVSKASIPFPESEHYVRIEAFVGESIVLSNAFRRTAL
jgi:hypothetical protein